MLRPVEPPESLSNRWQGGNNGLMATNFRALLVPASSRSRRLRRRYLRETRRPTHCLWFLLVLAGLHEALVLWVVQGSDPGRELLAQRLIQSLLGWFGFVGSWVPGVVLVAVLLIWHRVKRDRWRVRWWVLPAMVGESLVLAVPLLVLSALFAVGQGLGGAGLRAELVRALGAGIYEELVFRLLLISGLAWLLTELVQLRHPMSLWVAVVLAALLFALCHFEPIGWEVFAWKPFAFRVAAGGYLSVIFVGRGLGVSSGCHVAYNLVLVWLRSGGGG